MELFIAHPKTYEQLEAMKAFVKALKIDFEIEKPYDPKFVTKILKGEQDIADGKGIKIKTEDLWK